MPRKTDTKEAGIESEMGKETKPIDLEQKLHRRYNVPEYQKLCVWNSYSNVNED